LFSRERAPPLLETSGMDSTASWPSWPASWQPSAVPKVDDSRPACCARCKSPSRRGSRILLHGHGVRVRLVLILAMFADLPPEQQWERFGERLGECWERRYRCTACRAITVVLPQGVLPRYLYSVPAIVVAWFLVAGQPVGRGMTQAEAYDRQGMLRQELPRAFLEPDYRWRSLGRWARLASGWWTGWTGQISSLLTLFLEHAGRLGLVGAAEAAVRSHAGWGCRM